MKSIKYTLLALIFALPIAATAQNQKVTEKIFQADQVGTLHLRTQHGDIQVVQSLDNTIRITATETRATCDFIKDDMERWWDRYELHIGQYGNDIAVNATCGKRPSLILGGWTPKEWPPVRTDLVVAVPASWSVRVASANGSIELCDLSGDVHARAKKGDISVGKVGGTSDLQSKGGQVIVRNTTPDMSPVTGKAIAATR